MVRRFLYCFALVLFSFVHLQKGLAAPSSQQMVDCLEGLQIDYKMLASKKKVSPFGYSKPGEPNSIIVGSNGQVAWTDKLGIIHVSSLENDYKFEKNCSAETRKDKKKTSINVAHIVIDYMEKNFDGWKETNSYGSCDEAGLLTRGTAGAAESTGAVRY